MVKTIIDDRKAFVELKFGPNWSYISTVRIFIVNFLAITLEDKKRADNIAMAVNELIENAIKYSDRDGIEINLYVYDEGNNIKVQVCNHAEENTVRDLERILGEINKESPLDAYMKRMKESSQSINKKSTIGLARIYYETGAKIESSYEDGFVTVFAEFKDGDIGGTI